MFAKLIRVQTRSVKAIATRAFSSRSHGITISEQKVKVGSHEINYVKSLVEGENPTKTLVCLPGALGETAFNKFLIWKLEKLQLNF